MLNTVKLILKEDQKQVAKVDRHIKIYKHNIFIVILYKAII